MKKIILCAAALAVLTLPVLVRAIPQNIGGLNNNIMQEDRWDLPPNYEQWRLDGLGRDGRAPAAGDPAPRRFVNTKPVEFFGIPAPVGAAKLTADAEKWQSVEVSVPARKSDDFHLLQSTLKAETGKEIAVTGSKPSRGLVATVGKLRIEASEVADGGMEVKIARSDSSALSSAD